jgi:hypothetical protein
MFPLYCMNNSGDRGPTGEGCGIFRGNSPMKKGKKYKIWVEIQNINVLFVPEDSRQHTGDRRQQPENTRQDRTAGHYTVLKYVRSKASLEDIVL